MQIVDKAKRFIKKQLSIFQKRDSLKSLAKDDNVFVKHIALALSEVVSESYSSDEKSMIDKIEKIREELSSSQEKINVTSYGAGSRTLQKSAEQMYKGANIENTVGNICTSTSKPPAWAKILFKIIRKTKVQKCLELGTSLGISGSYQAAALKANGSGTLNTMEGAAEVAAIAERNFKSLNLSNTKVVVGRFQDNLDTVLKEDQYDYAFIDGHHEKTATINYFEKIYPSFSDQGIMIFDDIKWSKGMREAWDILTKDKRINVSIDLGPVGICVIKKNASNKKDYKLLIGKN